jgi:hypothetical protein
MLGDVDVADAAAAVIQDNEAWAATSNVGNKPVHVFRIDGSAWTDFLAPTIGETLLFSTATTIYAYGPNGQILSHGL